MLSAAADSGHGDAAFLVGGCHEAGNGTPADRVKALRYFEVAAAAGHVEASYRVGRAYFDGDGVPRDVQKGIGLMRVAAEADHPPAMSRYGIWLIDSGKADEGEKFVKAAAEKSDPDAALRYGRLLRDRADHHSAFRYFRIAAEAGQPEGLFALDLARSEPRSAYRYGVLLRDGEGVDPDPAAARKQFAFAARGGVAEASYELAETASSSGERIARLREAANGQHPPAMRKLGIAYLDGDQGVKKDPEVALEWLEKAHALGDVEATREATEGRPVVRSARELMQRMADKKADSGKLRELAKQADDLVDRELKWAPRGLTPAANEARRRADQLDESEASRSVIIALDGIEGRIGSCKYKEDADALLEELKAPQLAKIDSNRVDALRGRIRGLKLVPRSFTEVYGEVADIRVLLEREKVDEAKTRLSKLKGKIDGLVELSKQDRNGLHALRKLMLGERHLARARIERRIEARAGAQREANTLFEEVLKSKPSVADERGVNVGAWAAHRVVFCATSLRRLFLQKAEAARRHLNSPREKLRQQAKRSFRSYSNQAKNWDGKARDCLDRLEHDYPGAVGPNGRGLFQLATREYQTR